MRNVSLRLAPLALLLGAAAALSAATACSSAGSPAAGRVGPAGAPAAAPAPRPALIDRASLDGLIETSWQRAGVTPAPVASDGEFLRRVSLDLIGRVPSLAETRAFLALTSAAPAAAAGDRAQLRAQQRAQLVDGLLASPEFAEHWADVYGELLWKTEGSKKIEKYDPRSWLVTAFNENWPYDRLAGALLTATGNLYDNGAAAFITARTKGGGGPEAVAGATARIFLGLQIQCAQCHDHPYDPRWKQRDFYGLVAYFARTKVKRDQGGEGGAMMMGTTYLVQDVPRGEAKMQAPRSEDKVTVAPRFLGHQPDERRTDTRRQTLARAVLASDLFPKAMVARTWAQLFGAGLVDPWDDLGGEGDAKHPALLKRLAEEFRAGGFDIKALVRSLVLSTAYARSSGAAPGAPDDGGAAVRVFARARVRPLSPEQLFRSLLIATGADEMVRRKQNEERAERLVSRVLKEYRFTFDDDEMADADFDGSMPQALLLFNGELTNNGARAGEAGVLSQILGDSKDPARRIEGLFQAVYARDPDPAERGPLLEHLRGAGRDPRRAYEDVLFALLTSTEAITNH